MEQQTVVFCGWTEKRFKTDNLLEVTLFCLRRSNDQKWVGAMVGRHSGSHHYTYRVSLSFAKQYGAARGFTKRLQFGSRLQVIDWLQSMLSNKRHHAFCSFVVAINRPENGTLFNQRLPNILWEAFLRDDGYLKIYSGHKKYKIYPSNDRRSSKWNRLLISHKVKAGFMLKFVKRSLMEYDLDVYGPRYIYKSYPWQYINSHLFSLQMADDQKPEATSNVVVIDP